MEVTIKKEQYRPEEDRVQIVRVKHFEQDMVFSQGQWNEMGGYKGFVKSSCLSIRDIEGVEYTTMSAKEFSELPDWGS